MRGDLNLSVMPFPLVIVWIYGINKKTNIISKILFNNKKVSKDSFTCQKTPYCFIHHSVRLYVYVECRCRILNREQ